MYLQLKGTPVNHFRHYESIGKLVNVCQARRKMSQSLFRDLPSPAHQPEVKRRKVEDQTASLAGHVDDAGSTAFLEQSEEVKKSPNEPPVAAAQEEQAQPSPDAIVAALTKISTHIAEQKKFAKASCLLRQLLQV